MATLFESVDSVLKSYAVGGRLIANGYTDVVQTPIAWSGVVFGKKVAKFNDPEHPSIVVLVGDKKNGFYPAKSGGVVRDWLSQVGLGVELPVFVGYLIAALPFGEALGAAASERSDVLKVILSAHPLHDGDSVTFYRGGKWNKVSIPNILKRVRMVKAQEILSIHPLLVEGFEVKTSVNRKVKPTFNERPDFE